VAILSLCQADIGFQHPLFLVFLEGLLLTVVVNQVLQHVAWKLIHACIDSVGLVDNLAPEDFFEL